MLRITSNKTSVKILSPKGKDFAIQCTLLDTALHQNKRDYRHSGRTYCLLL
jgi:hypothetical protein